MPCETIDEVFRAVETGRADYAVVPVENSTEGAVSRTLDLIVGSSLKICGEVLLPIHQNLLRLPAAETGAKDALDGIRRVFSHAQSLAQCQHWLNRHLPQSERIPVSSNAEAARLAAQDGSAAAIAGDIAAEIYGLGIVAPRIEDEPNNTTRFLVLADHDASPSGKDRTSLVLSASNVPGAIVKLLQPLADAGISMTKLESRPTRSANWEYLFFVDVEGHCDDPVIAGALKEIGTRSLMLKVLGSYPAAC
jgi:chorismate mutase/prephenate dehydratase